MRVSKRWKHLLSSPPLWREICVEWPSSLKRKPLPRSLVSRISSCATIVKTITWKVTYAPDDLDTLRNLMISPCCTSLEVLNIKFAHVTWSWKLPQPMNHYPLTNEHLKPSAPLIAASLRSLELSGGVAIALHTLKDILVEYPNLSDVDVKIEGPWTIEHERSLLPWSNLPHLRRLSLDTPVQMCGDNLGMMLNSAPVILVRYYFIVSLILPVVA